MCWDCYNNLGGDPYKNFRRGAVEVEDFDDEVKARHPKRRTRKARLRAALKEPRGCIGNDFKAHVYVWTSEFMLDDLFYRYYGFHKYERNICIGCGRKNGRRETARYDKIKYRRYRKMYGNEFDVVRGQGPVSRRHRRYKPSYSYYAWETFDLDYKAYRADYIKKHGYNTYVDGNRYDW